MPNASNILLYVQCDLYCFFRSNHVHDISIVTYVLFIKENNRLANSVNDGNVASRTCAFSYLTPLYMFFKPKYSFDKNVLIP